MLRAHVKQKGLRDRGEELAFELSYFYRLWVSGQPTLDIEYSKVMGDELPELPAAVTFVGDPCSPSTLTKTQWATRE